MPDQINESPTANGLACEDRPARRRTNGGAKATAGHPAEELLPRRARAPARRGLGFQQKNLALDQAYQIGHLSEDGDPLD